PTPSRTEPTSTPRRTPGRIPGSGTELPSDRRQGLLDLAGVLPAARGAVVLAAATAAERARADAHEGAGGSPLRAGRLVGGDDDDGLAGGVAGEGDDGGALLAQLRTGVGDHLAQVLGAAAGHVVTDEGDPGDVAGVLGQRPRGGSDLLAVDLLQLLLDLTQPGDHVRDALGQ